MNKAKIAGIKATEQALEAQQKQVAAMDSFRSSLEGTIAGVLDGTMSIKNAFKSMADAIIQQIARMIAQQWVEKLFGQQGTLGGSTSGGGWLSSLFGAFSGGSGPPGHADGTDFAAGGLAWVGERGRELVNLPRGSQVIPNHKLGQIGGITQIFHQHYAAPNDPRSEQQRAARVGFETRRAFARNGR